MNWMKSMIGVTAAGAVALGMTLGGCNRDDGKTPGEKVGGAVQKGVDSTTKAAENVKNRIVANVTPSGADSITGIRSAVEGVVTNAVDKNNWSDMLDHLTAADRQRLTAGKPDTADLDAAIGAFKRTWHDKYGGDAFPVMDASEVYADPFMTVAPEPAGSTDHGVATIKESHGLKELKVPAVVQDGKWRLDVPDTVGPKELHDSLLATVTKLTAAAAAWPTDEKSGYRIVTHHVLMAMMGEK